jgi:hypothetical protein
VANLVHHLNRDFALLQAIAGVDNPKDGDITIVEDYFTNERMINRREQGYEVPEDYQPSTRCEYETRVWRNHLQLSEIEQGRSLKPFEWDDILLERDEDDNYIPQPNREVVVII